jgi:hypothetical protein
MPSPKPSPAATAIEAAYESQVQTLFKFLITNLGDQPVSHQTDQECLDQFIRGLNVAKRAKQLVQNVVVSSPLGARPRRTGIKGKSPQ